MRWAQYLLVVFFCSHLVSQPDFVVGQMPAAEAQRMLEQARGVLGSIPDPEDHGASDGNMFVDEGGERVDPSTQAPPVTQQSAWDSFQHISADNFDEVLEKGVWLVYVCGNCKAEAANILSEFRARTEVSTAVIQALDHPVAASRLFAFDVPSLVLVRNRNVYKFNGGSVTADHLVEWVSTGYQKTWPMSKWTSPFEEMAPILTAMFQVGDTLGHGMSNIKIGPDSWWIGLLVVGFVLIVGLVFGMILSALLT